METIKKLLEKSKSGKKGEIDQLLINHILSLSKDSETKNIIKECFDGFENFGYDTIYYKGDWKINSDFDPFDFNISNIIIDGNLYVDGVLNIKDDPRTLFFVIGNINAKSLINSGYLIINGNLSIEQSLIGDYNHGSVTVFGNTKADFFHPENHFFELKRDIDFKFAFGDTHCLNDNKNKKIFNLEKRHFKKLISLMHPELLKSLNQEYQEYIDEIEYTEEIWEFLERDSFLDHIKSGKPVLK